MIVMTVIIWVAPAGPRLNNSRINALCRPGMMRTRSTIRLMLVISMLVLIGIIAPARSFGCGVKGAFEIKVYGPYFQGVKFYFQQMSGGGQVPTVLLS